MSSPSVCNCSRLLTAAYLSKLNHCSPAERTEIWGKQHAFEHPRLDRQNRSTDGGDVRWRGARVHLPHAAPLGCHPGLIAFISLMIRFQRTSIGSPSQASQRGAIIICCFSRLRGFLSGRLSVAFTSCTSPSQRKQANGGV